MMLRMARSAKALEIVGGVVGGIVIPVMDHFSRCTTAPTEAVIVQ
jgi:hypothetical protein